MPITSVRSGQGDNPLTVAVYTHTLLGQSQNTAATKVTEGPLTIPSWHDSTHIVSILAPLVPEGQ